ncbi:tetratricopeptide repeat protein [Kitasatospora sp. NPDC097643]|uniref:tetratricopeptide repeat protein n=1 Tax=Kitasatospora sp. NPDC097643 TaxID=3157230 RepID=UPI003330CF80
MAHNQRGDGAAGLAYAQMALDLDRSAETSGFMVSTMAFSYLHMEDFAAAEIRFREALEIWRCHGNANHVAITLSNLGDALRGLGRREEALAVLGEARQIHQRMGNLDSLADCLVVTGRAHTHFGEWDDARVCFQRAVDIAREHGLGALIVQGTEGLDEHDRLRGCPEDAGRCG